MPYTLKGYFASIFDSFVSALKGIDIDHYYIHQGKKFYYSENISLNAAATKVITFKTPTLATGKEIHFRNDMVDTSGDKVLIQLFEGDVISGGSDKLTSVFNYNRKSTNTTTMQLFKTGTTQSTPGTIILNDYVGGGTGVGQSKTGSKTTQKEERVLKNDTIYSLLYTNNSGSSNVINTIISWYEETI